MNRLVREFQIEHYDQAIALWKRTPGVGLSAADERERIDGSRMSNAKA